ncbi:MAG TPA: TetR/AcrR family transcriptional regulator [Acidimicrobiales bacterium]|jgi:AcrR family transcriptional regulator|nr:TetR/AcrR family transcriptional regulator [Acidimicrobiales bacterium]
MTVAKEPGGTRQRIIECTEQLLLEIGSSDLHLTKVAERAQVGLQTIYYHFESRTQLIARAQASAYLRLIAPLHGYLEIVERALAERDEETYWRALGENTALSWSYAHHDDKWQTTTLLIDIWADDFTREEFRAALDVQVERWVTVIDAGKPLGWVREDLDTYALVTTCWAGSIGQSIFANSEKNHYSPESINDFFLSVVRARPEYSEHSSRSVLSNRENL